MVKGILGKKIGMTQIFNSKGFLIPITIVDVSNNVVVQQKTIEKDGYLATQLGFSDQREKVTTKPLLGHFKNAQTSPKRFVKEIRFQHGIKNLLSDFKLGSIVTPSLFNKGDIIDITGISKGKGFAGVIKRHKQSRGPESHGSRYHRRPGSMGPIKGKLKGKKLAGRMGSQTSTIQNLEIISIDNEKNIFLISGSLPGPKKGYLVIKTAIKRIMKEHHNA